jgi:hypothetical protein
VFEEAGPLARKELDRTDEAPERDEAGYDAVREGEAGRAVKDADREPEFDG